MSNYTLTLFNSYLDEYVFIETTKICKNQLLLKISKNQWLYYKKLFVKFDTIF